MRKFRGPMQQYNVGAPLERVALDILGPFPETYNGNRYILLTSDYFCRWVEAFGMPDQEASTVADCLVEGSFPGSEEVPSDQHVSNPSSGKTLDNSFSLSEPQNSTDLSNGETLTNSSPRRPVSQSNGKTLDDASNGNDSLSRCESTTRTGRKTKLPGYIKDYKLEFICQL